MLRKTILAIMLMLALCPAPSFATVSSTSSRMDYTGNGAVDTYSYNFRIFANTDLLVTVRDTSDVETTLTLTTDYTVTGVGSSSGGNVVLVNSAQAWLDGDGDLKSGYALTIRRVRPLTQLTDIRNQGNFYPETHEDTFDHLVMVDQQQQDELDRSMKLPETIDPSTFDTNLPADLVGNIGVSIIVNDAGDGFSAGPTADEITAAQTNATAAAASASAAASSSSSAASSAAAAAASAASISLPTITGNSLNILQANAGGTALQYMDLRAPNVGIGTVTPNKGKFTTLEGTTVTATTTFTGPGALPSGAVFFMASGSCPSWTTDISATYANKFIKINGTQLTASGVVLTGATDSHTLTTAEMPAHRHEIYGNTGGSGTPTYLGSVGTADATTLTVPNTATESVGGGGGHTHNLSTASTLEPSSITMKACQVN